MIMQHSDERVLPPANLDFERSNQHTITVHLQQKHIASMDLAEANLQALQKMVGDTVNEAMEARRNKPLADIVRGKEEERGTPSKDDQVMVVFDASGVNGRELKHGNITNLGKLLSSTNLYLSRRGFGSNVELISRDPTINEAMNVSGMSKIIHLTHPDMPASKREESGLSR